MCESLPYDVIGPCVGACVHTVYVHPVCAFTGVHMPNHVTCVSNLDALAG